MHTCIYAESTNVIKTPSEFDNMLLLNASLYLLCLFHINVFYYDLRNNHLNTFCRLLQASCTKAMGRMCSFPSSPQSSGASWGTGGGVASPVQAVMVWLMGISF